MEITEKNKVQEGQMFLLQAAYSSYNWIYRTTKTRTISEGRKTS
jgi:hypothetical protein